MCCGNTALLSSFIMLMILGFIYVLITALVSVRILG